MVRNSSQHAVLWHGLQHNECMSDPTAMSDIWAFLHNGTAPTQGAPPPPPSLTPPPAQCKGEGADADHEGEGNDPLPFPTT
jgi:hypothetical protein